MRLSGFKELARAMRREAVADQHFRFAFGRRSFSVLFFIDCEPWELFVAGVGVKDPPTFSFKVMRGFEVDPHLPRDEYRALCEFLELNYDPNNPFRPATWLRALESAAPACTSSKRLATYEVARVVSADEPDKTYFLGFMRLPGKKRPTAGNLRKTRYLIGPEFAKRCAERGYSSCWTADPARAKDPRFGAL